jgi:hypothetical protein
MKMIARSAFTVAVTLGAVAVATYRPVHIQAQPAAIGPVRFHHVHLNSVDPASAAEYYVKPFGASSAKTTFNGYEALKTGDIYLLFTKVNTPPLTELNAPQSSVWHFGWNTPDSRKYNERFRAEHLEIAEMWDANDGRLVDMSSDALSLATGPGFPTQEQIFELRAKGAQPTRQGGFGYLRGPDRAMIENAQSGQVERFNHVHMYHEHPQCAMIWYITHLGATLPPGPGGAPGVLPTAADCRRPYSPPTFPSFAKSGFVREPRGSVMFGDINIAMVPWPGGGLVGTRGYVVDHWAVSVPNLDSTAARLKSEGVRFLEEIHAWGSMRALMIEGPDRIAIEVVEVK